MFKYMGYMHLCNAPSVNNCDPKDYLFFKDLWAFKKDLP